MLILAIDIETTGLDPETHQILEFGAVLEDTNNLLSYQKIPKINLIIERSELSGSVFALDMNKRIIEILKNYSVLEWQSQERVKMQSEFNIIKEHELVGVFDIWMHESIESTQAWKKKHEYRLNVAGKNYTSFDNKFLQKLHDWKGTSRSFNRRIIDPSVLYVDWINDKELPSLDECLKRADIKKSVSHKAVEDAWDVIQVLRKKY